MPYTPSDVFMPLRGQPRHLSLDLGRLRFHLLPPAPPESCSWQRFWFLTLRNYITLAFILMITLYVSRLITGKVRKQDGGPSEFQKEGVRGYHLAKEDAKGEAGVPLHLFHNFAKKVGLA